jgi:hypothetical protein
LSTAHPLAVGVLYLLPLAVLVVVLLAGRYPGETVLEGALRRALPRRRVRAPRVLAATPRPPARTWRGGVVIARSLGRRGPPPARWTPATRSR